MALTTVGSATPWPRFAGREPTVPVPDRCRFGVNGAIVIDSAVPHSEIQQQVPAESRVS